MQTGILPTACCSHKFCGVETRLRKS